MNNMSSVQDETRKAQAPLTPEENMEFYREFQYSRSDEFSNWVLDNKAKIRLASPEIHQKLAQKWEKFYPNDEPPWAIEGEKEGWTLPPTQESIVTEAPAVISEQTKSDPKPPPESQDVEYLSWEEVKVFGNQVHTLDYVLVEDPNGEHFIERCVGKNQDTHKYMVVRIPATRVKIEPHQVMQYLGTVVKDHQSVHTGVAKSPRSRRAIGYSFDRFYIHDKKRYERCCYVPNMVHQAYLMFEKVVDRHTRKPRAIIRRQRTSFGQPSDSPVYKVLGVGEAHYRDLKRIFERNFLRHPQEDLADDIGLKLLLGVG